MNELQIAKLILTSCQTITGKTKAFEHLNTLEPLVTSSDKIDWSTFDHNRTINC